MSKFKIGDRVVIVKSPSPNRVGMVLSVVEIVPNMNFMYMPEYDGSTSYRLNMLSETIPGALIGYPACCLELYKDDSNEKGEWTDELRRLCKAKENVNV